VREREQCKQRERERSGERECENMFTERIRERGKEMERDGAKVL
jgi:hypothetical protein